MPEASNLTSTQRLIRAVLLLAACGIALFNGSLWSPIYDSVSYILYLSTRNFPFMTAARAADATPVVIAIMTLLLAGIPAAIYERIRRTDTTTIGSMLVWLVATLALSAQTIINATGG